MTNPYRDEHGKYCSKEEMRSAVTRLQDAGKEDEATLLYLDYKNASVDKTTHTLDSLRNSLKNFRTNPFATGDPHGTHIPDTFKAGEPTPAVPPYISPDVSPTTPRFGKAAYEKMMAEHNGENQTSASTSSFVDEDRYRNIKKMPALFVIDREAHAATTEINEAAAWIFTEKSTPTIKRDGTSITVTEDGQVMARRSVKKGKQAPPGFIHAETDSYTGHQFGVEPIEQSGFNKMFQEAAAKNGGTLEPGTYELCGPKVNGNPEGLDRHSLIKHGSEQAGDIPDMRTMNPAEAYEKLREIFQGYKEDGIEGIVWWGADGKRTKLRVKDFFGDPDRR